MAKAFARLPLRVLWRLSGSEVPDQAALDDLHLGNNTKVPGLPPAGEGSLFPVHVFLPQRPLSPRPLPCRVPADATIMCKVLHQQSPHSLSKRHALLAAMQVATWIPQNDVLGHKQTRVFLSHCGANSLYEAAYHGVPIVGLPFFAGEANIHLCPGNLHAISHLQRQQTAAMAEALDICADADQPGNAAKAVAKVTPHAS